MRPHRPRRPFMQSALFKRFHSAAKRVVDDDAVEKLLGEADRYAASRPSIRSAMLAVKRKLFDGLLARLGPLGDLVKAMLRPGGRRLANETKELKGLSNIVEALGPNLRPAGRDRDRMKAELGDLLEQQGFRVEKPATHSELAPHRGREREPVEFEEWQGPEPKRLPSNVVEVRVGGTLRRFKQSDPTITGAMIPVTSSNVHSIGYAFNWNDPAKGALKVQFLQDGPRGKKSGPGPLYHYHGVHPDLFLRFRLAASAGKFVWDRLRVRGTVSGHQYQYSLEGVSGGYVPRKATRFGNAEYFVQRSIKARSTRTGEVKTLSSKLPDRLVRRLPDRGRPNRGIPNRGR